ncbi:hydrogen peroxide-inducible genes activator [Photobacterium aphoticum]|uniref:Hydrogen peroxide-inducible genes activator n=1 Tax=Photobacterium aphoticum TaxID=754436 RepID=A0A090QRX6_9GAMM|nr:hydrogen peroxide-inducible genes activator [Photobacterium aphoticum]
MDLRLLRCFVAVYEEKNITLAAERCFVSQPAISSAIKQLENELNTPLFERHKKGVTLTDEAHYLYPLAVRLLADVQRLPGLFQARTQCLTLKLAHFPDLSQSALATVMATLRAQIPHLLLELVDHDAPADARLTLDMFKQDGRSFCRYGKRIMCCVCCRITHWHSVTACAPSNCMNMILLSARPVKPISRPSDCWPVTAWRSI